MGAVVQAFTNLPGQKVFPAQGKRKTIFSHQEPGKVLSVQQEGTPGEQYLSRRDAEIRYLLGWETGMDFKG